jgi:glycosyltransferase involved in cell wall biosynthesis
MARTNIKFVGELTDAKLGDYYRKCAALILPQEEDFGIVALEAQAAGAPVIAFRAGGALDTVKDQETGVFFDKQDAASLARAVKRFEGLTFEREKLKKNAERFSKENFKKNFLELTKKYAGL